MDNLQEMKYRFSTDTDYRFIDLSVDEIEAFVDDFNYNKVNELLKSSKYIKRGNIQPLKPIMPIIEHIVKSVNKAFYDSVCGIYSPIPHADTIPLEVYKLIKSDEVKPNVIIKPIANMKLQSNVLHLGTHTRCICAETGISFAVALPSPIDTSMTLLHPFAFHNNVITFVKQYQRNGIPLAQLESQALAGMLITILKHKGYASCRDYVAANLRLRTINKKSLTWALAYFYRAEPRYNLPQINLLAEGNPTTQLIGFIQICKGEDTTIQAHHSLESKQKTIKARVFQTEHAKEAAHLKNDVKSCLAILETIEENNPTISEELFISFTHRIRKIAVLNDAAKEILITDLIGSFGENVNTKQLELIIRQNDMTATQKELFTFSQEIAKDLAEFKGNKEKGKIDFASLMGKVK